MVEKKWRVNTKHDRKNIEQKKSNDSVVAVNVTETTCLGPNTASRIVGYHQGTNDNITHSVPAGNTIFETFSVFRRRVASSSYPYVSAAAEKPVNKRS